MYKKANDFSAAHVLLLNSQDISQALEHVKKFPPAWTPNDVTGCMVLVGEGEYLEVWVTESRRPYNNSAQFEKCKI